MDAGPIYPAIGTVFAVEFTVPGVPVPWARTNYGMGARTAGNFTRITPEKQRNFMATLKAMAADAMRGEAPFEGPIELSVRATWPMPASRSAKKRAGTKWRTSRPDADNCAKIVADSLNGICWRDDAQVASLHVWKTFGERAELVVRIVELRA